MVLLSEERGFVFFFFLIVDSGEVYDFRFTRLMDCLVNGSGKLYFECERWWQVFVGMHGECAFVRGNTCRRIFLSGDDAWLVSPELSRR